MKVSELIAELQTLPAHLDVTLEAAQEPVLDYEPVESVFVEPDDDGKPRVVLSRLTFEEIKAGR
jgi:hypothetical protein